MEERPYLQKPLEDLNQAWFQPMGCRLLVVSNSRAVIDIARESFGIFGAVRARRSPDLTFHLHENEVDDGVLGQPIFRSQGPLVYQTTGRDSVLVVNREAGLAYGYFSRTTLGEPDFFRWHFLDPALFFLLEWRDFIGIHGAALCRDGRAVLLRGASGQGKSTLAYAGARSRFQALAEDVVWMDAANDRWWGIPSSFHLLSDAKTLFPELSSAPAARGLNGEIKVSVDLSSIRPNSTATSARPGPVVLLQRAPGETCRLERLGYEESRREWGSGSSVKEHEAPAYDRYVSSILRRGAYRLHFGDDIPVALDLLEPLFD